MFGFKKKEAEPAADEPAAAPAEEKSSGLSGNVEVELTKIKSQLEALNEVRKSTSERFTRIAEQVGELRGMIVDTNKTMTNVEVASTKAVDLVNAVHPDQLMVEVRKSEGKVEGLKAIIEANEAMLQDIMKEMKEVRRGMAFYKGADQVVKLNEEVKTELFTIKKVQAIVSTHADRVDTIFLEVEKKFAEFNKFNDTVKDLARQMEKLSSDFEKIRVSIDKKEEKTEFVNLLNKFNAFEKHSTNILKLLDVKMKTTELSLKESFRHLVQEVNAKLKTDVDAAKIQQTVDKDLGEETATPGPEAAAPSTATGAAAGAAPPEKKEPKLALKSLFKKDAPAEGKPAVAAEPPKTG